MITHVNKLTSHLLLTLSAMNEVKSTAQSTAMLNRCPSKSLLVKTLNVKQSSIVLQGPIDSGSSAHIF